MYQPIRNKLVDTHKVYLKNESVCDWPSVSKFKYFYIFRIHQFSVKYDFI